ncbi:unnamed protein product [Effrenium voratum]|nr:unnamed protein product [Effrenium voratum]
MAIQIFARAQCLADRVALDCWRLNGETMHVLLPSDGTFEELSAHLGQRVVSIISKGQNAWGSQKPVQPMEKVLDFLRPGEVEASLSAEPEHLLAMQALWALECGAFCPDSPALDLNWKMATPDPIAFEENVKKYIGAVPLCVRKLFLQVLEAQLAEGETWNMLHLSLLQSFPGEVRRFKHIWTKQAAEFAAHSAICPVSAHPPSSMFFRKNDKLHIIGVCVASADGQFPSSVQEDTHMLEKAGLLPQDPRNLDGAEFRRLVVSMEGCLSLMPDSQNASPFIPSDFESDQLMQLLHVQLRLSCGLAAVVEEGFNIELARCLAQMLQLRFEDSIPDMARGSLVLHTLARNPSHSIWERVEAEMRRMSDSLKDQTVKSIFVLCEHSPDQATQRA